MTFWARNLVKLGS